MLRDRSYEQQLADLAADVADLRKIHMEHEADASPQLIRLQSKIEELEYKVAEIMEDSSYRKGFKRG